VFRDGERITEGPLAPGASLSLSENGVYGAVAVEGSGLEGERSLPWEIQSATTLSVLQKVPSDFYWTRDRYLVDGRGVPAEEAKQHPEAVRETVHLHDGVIHREWLQHGQLTKGHDLNLDGEPIRQLYYQDGRLAKREYYDRDGEHVSSELFDSEGFITESLHGRNHWWYDRGMPQRFESSSSLFVRDGDPWIRKR
jgi:hypothetical protein